jgi:hypothetical protein
MAGSRRLAAILTAAGQARLPVRRDITNAVSVGLVMALVGRRLTHASMFYAHVAVLVSLECVRCLLIAIREHTRRLLQANRRFEVFATR